jgi:hypothetical protein
MSASFIIDAVTGETYTDLRTALMAVLAGKEPECNWCGSPDYVALQFSSGGIEQGRRLRRDLSGEVILSEATLVDMLDPSKAATA